MTIQQIERHIDKLEDELADAHQRIGKLEQAILAVIDHARAVCQCPFCDGYSGFAVEDPAFDEQWNRIGHDMNCPWPMLKLAYQVGQTRIGDQ